MVCQPEFQPEVRVCLQLRPDDPWVLGQSSVRLRGNEDVVGHTRIVVSESPVSTTGPARNPLFVFKAYIRIGIGLLSAMMVYHSLMFS